MYTVEIYDEKVFREEYSTWANLFDSFLASQKGDWSFCQCLGPWQGSEGDYFEICYEDLSVDYIRTADVEFSKKAGFSLADIKIHHD